MITLYSDLLSIFRAKKFEAMGEFTLIENYPELKSNQHLTQLLASLNEIEEQISAARRFYNAAVTEYNNALEMFPSNIIAAKMNYSSKELFITNSLERANVDLGNLFNN